MRGVTVIKKTVVVRRCNPAVTVIRHPNIVKVTAQVPILHKQLFKAFSLVAIQGQSLFELPSFALANGMVFLSINGTMQDPIAGDYSINGDVLLIGAPLDAGDHIYGMYEEA